MHYQRWLLHGDPVAPYMYPVQACSVDGCERRSASRGYCKTHYRQWQRTGTTTSLKYSRNDPKVCVVCGARDWPDNNRRRHCSGRCQALDSRHKGARPEQGTCTECGNSFSLLELTKTGQFKRTDTKKCDACRRARALRHKTSVMVLADRDGTSCGICMEPVDMTLRYPDPMAPSVDHIIPYEQSRSHDLDGLRLTHLHCNHVKSDRHPTTGRSHRASPA